MLIGEWRATGRRIAVHFCPGRRWGHRRWICAPTFRLDSTFRSSVGPVADQSAILGSASRRGLESGQDAFSAFLVAERPAQRVCAEMRPTWCTFGPSFAPAAGDLCNFCARGGQFRGLIGERRASGTRVRVPFCCGRRRGPRGWISAPTFFLDPTYRSSVDPVADQPAILGSGRRRELESGQNAFSAFLVAERPAQRVCAEMRPTCTAFGPSLAPAVGDLCNFWARGG